ncbi:hypothetical protein KAFR_0B03860 [Kazachstania africana CBS 2517]|uniref:Protein Zds1 C-terminal domain-containing protein n=1 Tax=Kazachstania africana (strain ATCC 22294 / BCRC 22015 / CBS 2517 / CECT 1963 / NBRC 1671 / NRRL Y-8276) TaxID=1071382 RepID=H2AQN2_KAZAF|nr:hypothetical protein KAFR_0B03860 [Kazachstania africana CBS 2517]CCF56682.1 hypothetical protein KAFR_0B03860 [Kazachstania africana CBS 2517]
MEEPIIQKEQRNSRIYLAAQSLGHEVQNVNHLKRLSVGSIDMLTDTDVEFSFNKLQRNISAKKTQEILSQKRTSTETESVSYNTLLEGFYGSDDAEDESEKTTRNTSISETRDKSPSVPARARGRKVGAVSRSSRTANLGKKGGYDKEISKGLLWVSADVHPNVKPENYIELVQDTLEQYNSSDYSISERLPEDKQVLLSAFRAKKSHSLVRKPSKLRKSYISIESNNTPAENNDANAHRKPLGSSRDPVVSTISLKELSEELAKISSSAGLTKDDAITLATTLWLTHSLLHSDNVTTIKSSQDIDGYINSFATSFSRSGPLEIPKRSVLRVKNSARKRNVSNDSLVASVRSVSSSIVSDVPDDSDTSIESSADSVQVKQGNILNVPNQINTGGEKVERETSEETNGQHISVNNPTNRFVPAKDKNAKIEEESDNKVQEVKSGGDLIDFLNTKFTHSHGKFKEKYRHAFGNSGGKKIVPGVVPEKEVSYSQKSRFEQRFTNLFKKSIGTRTTKIPKRTNDSVPLSIPSNEEEPEDTATLENQNTNDYGNKLVSNGNLSEDSAIALNCQYLDAIKGRKEAESQVAASPTTDNRLEPPRSSSEKQSKRDLKAVRPKGYSGSALLKKHSQDRFNLLLDLGYQTSSDRSSSILGKQTISARGSYSHKAVGSNTGGLRASDPSHKSQYHGDVGKQRHRGRKPITSIQKPTNMANYQHKSILPPRKLTFDDVKKPEKVNGPMQYTDSAFGFPLPLLTVSTVIMYDCRLATNVERAIYRLSHLKLGNRKRPLREQVLVSNFMYAYLNLVNHTLFMEQSNLQRKPKTSMLTQTVGNAGHFPEKVSPGNKYI